MVVEGYTDVISLHQAGFGGAVAPLGTALTEEQLEEIWRISPMPVLCFDGDAAGGRAAARAAELVLPMLTAERSLRLATLPPAEDPDSLVRNKGPAGFQGVLDSARPLSEALYDLIREGSGDDTPELRAGLKTRLEAAAAKIRDKTLASEYRRALLDRFFARRPPPPGRARPGFKPLRPPPAFHRPVPAAASAADERGRNMVAILLHHPGLLHDVEEAFASIDLPPALDSLRAAILQWGEAAETLDSAALMTHLTQTGLAVAAAQALSAVPIPLPACAAVSAMPAEAEAGLVAFLWTDEPGAPGGRSCGSDARIHAKRRQIDRKTPDCLVHRPQRPSPGRERAGRR